MTAVARKRWRYLAASLLLLAPCYWQPRLQAGDLSSHIYNAWLVQLIENGAAPGLAVVRRSTNILFDLMLSGLFRAVGPEWAQRLAVSAAVLIFVWGVFAFIAVVSGRRPWGLMPAIAMLAYGWVFHMGFFNFYLALGLSFWALALAWDLQPRRLAAAVLILALAYLAHALPVLWAAGLVAYVALARRLAPRQRLLATAACVLALAALHAASSLKMYTRWSPVQLTLVTGLDQVCIFDGKYYAVLIGLLAVWGLLFLGLVRQKGPRQVISSLPFQICVIGAAVVMVLPGTVLIPGFYHALNYIAERMSLGVAICVCALLGTVRVRRLERMTLYAVALTYFAFLYHDERELNRFEDRMQDTVAQLKPGRRVAAPSAIPACASTPCRP